MVEAGTTFIDTTSTEEGRYTFNSLIFDGKSKIFECIDHKLNRRFALKLLNYNSDDINHLDPNILETSLQQEAKILAGLKNRYIAEVYDLMTIEDPSNGKGLIPAMAVEFFDPKKTSTLDKVSRNLSLEEKCRVADQIAEAIDYAHRHGVVHRDIKSPNIMINENGDAILNDFELTPEIFDRNLREEEGGILMGSLAYLAPEVVKLIQGDNGFINEGYVDLYAFGSTLFEMLTGQTPFADGDNRIEVIACNIINEPYNKYMLSYAYMSHVIGSESHKVIEAFFDRALAKNPYERFSSATEMAIEFRNALTGLNLNPGALKPNTETEVSTRPLFYYQTASD